MSHRTDIKHRLDKNVSPTVRGWKKIGGPMAEKGLANVVIPCGWGRLIFAHTFADLSQVADVLLQEKPGQRDIAFYLSEPHVLLSKFPEKLFLDPSHAYRLWLDQYKQPRTRPGGFILRRAQTREEALEINRIYASRRMVEADPEFIVKKRNSRTITYFVAENESSGEIIGTIMGLDHVHGFQEPENGASFWCLAVDPQAPYPRIGEALIRHVIEYYSARGRSYLDLSVMHDNAQAISLYEKLGFQRVPVFAVKRKNPINEPLFTDPQKLPHLNPYAEIIIKEALRRGIEVEVLDNERAHFALIHGGRRMTCWESLSEMTSAIALVRCDDKSLTRKILHNARLRVPAQQPAGTRDENLSFLEQHESIVVKPKRGEQGAGIAVDVRTAEEMEAALAKAREVCTDVLLEEFIQGEDLRIIVIDGNVVAAAVRKPAQIIGNGTHTVAQLIEKQSRRRAAATGGESRIPVDEETLRCLRAQELDMDSVLEEGRTVPVRKTANLHTGGTIHDVTEHLHPELVNAAQRAAASLEIPLVGFDFMVKAVDQPEYAIIEANERPGLANHEPQPTAQRFIDMLFPQTTEYS